jgi:hypothetical protein
MKKPNCCSTKDFVSLTDKNELNGGMVVVSEFQQRSNKF